LFSTFFTKQEIYVGDWGMADSEEIVGFIFQKCSETIFKPHADVIFTLIYQIQKCSFFTTFFYNLETTTKKLFSIFLVPTIYVTRLSPC